jgi:hypothetical protein
MSLLETVFRLEAKLTDVINGVLGSHRSTVRDKQPLHLVTSRELAESYIRGGSGCLYRHYNIRGVQDILRGKIGSQGFIACLPDDEVVAIVQKVRNEKGMGPIAKHNMPNHVNPDEFIDLSGM